MANHSYTTDVVTEQNNTNAVDIGDYEFLYLAQSTTISALGSLSDGIHGTEYIQVKIGGDVFGRYHGIETDTGGNSNVSINSTGSVSSGFFEAIYLSGSNNVVTNYGDVNGPDGIHFTGGNATLKNFGNVHADGTAVDLGGNAGDKNTILNNGFIDGGNAIRCGIADDIVTNTGTISGGVSLSKGNDIFDSHMGVLFGTVDGGDGNDIIKGGISDDHIIGGNGIDTLSGGSGDDSFLFNTKFSLKNIDHITDFAHGQDHIALDDAFFKGVKGSLLSTQFHDITTATEDTNDHILYNHNKGTLYYDVDGAGGIKAVLFAVLDNHVALNYHDFLVV